jgi:hypothetical protein|tara:strand:+ start:1254 stop:1832 length:579 start_codon:yes stop_codon:yes gene_type:complete
MTTISKVTEQLATIGAKFNVEGIDLVEVGAMHTVNANEKKLVNTYAFMVASDILPSDYLSHSNRESTATKAQYQARAEAAKLICYNKPERAELATKLPMDAPQAEKDKRKKLQSRHTELLKTIRRGLTTAHKKAHPEEYKKGGANELKTAIEDLAALMEKATKLLQGDKPFPETFAHDDAIAVVKGFVKTFC